MEYFSVLMMGVMARPDWLDDPKADIGKAVLDIALENYVIYREMGEMAKMD